MHSLLPRARLVAALGVAVALAFARPVPSLAQGASVGAVAVAARHQLLGDPLTGGAVAVLLPRPDGRLAVRLGAERLRGDAERTGIPCAGLIRPGTCPPERLRDAARLTGAAGGVAWRALGARRAAVALTADLSLASLRADTRGLTSGDALSTTKVLWGGWVGAEASWAPLSRVPLALELGGAVGGLMPVVREQVADGYTPFNHGFDVARLRLGIAWRGLAGG